MAGALAAEPPFAFGTRLPLALLCACLLAGLGTAALPSPAAGAAPIPVGDAGSAPLDVALAGRAVVWPRLAARYAEPVEVVSATPGTAATTILRGEVTPGSAVEQLPTIDADGRTVVVSLTDYARTERSVRVLAANVFAGPPQPWLERLRGIRRDEAAGTVAVDDGTLGLILYKRKGRHPRPRLVLRDTHGGWKLTRRLSRYNAGISLALAGRYVATLSQRGVQDRTRVLVRDIRTWRVRTSAVVPEDALDVAVALRADGAVAIVYGFDRLRAALIAPGGTRLQRLTPRPASLDVRFGRRGIIYPHRVHGGARLVEVTPRGGLRRLTTPIRGLVSFDADGRRLALRTRRCVYSAVAPALTRPPPCPPDD